MTLHLPGGYHGNSGAIALHGGVFFCPFIALAICFTFDKM